MTTDLEDRLTAALHRRAASTHVHERLDDIVNGVTVVPLAAAPARSHRLVRIVAAAATLAVVTGVGAVLWAQRPSDSLTVPTDQTSAAYFPVLGPLGDLDAAVSGTGATPDPSDTPLAALTVGRVDGHALRDLVTVFVSRVPQAEVGPTELSGRDGVVLVRTISGFSVVLTSAQDGSLLTQVADALTIEPDRSGGAVVGVSALPQGLAVLDGPTQLSLEPWPGASTDTGTKVGVEIYVSDHLQLDSTVKHQIVKVGDVVGYLHAYPDGVALSWPIGGGRWAHLSTRGIDVERTIEIAEDVRYADRAGWERHYDDDLDNYRSVPTTAAAPPSS